MPRTRLLITDLDGTLVGDEAALRRFRSWWQEARDDVVLVYATGRAFESVRALAREAGLPAPRWCVCSVGTEIRHWNDGRELPEWAARAASFDAPRLRRALAAEPELREQPAEFQTARKLSYYSHGLSERRLVQLRARVAAAGEMAQLVYSSDRDLDLLPVGMDKGSAASFLARQHGAEADEVLVCGDSGNDRALFRTGFRGVVVRNAQPELRNLRGDHVYHATASHADGVLEGLAHHFPEAAAR